jgi:hypothetical protein
LNSESRLHREEVPAALRWCVGKFAYVRGSPHPIHFMELKSFIIDDAVDYSHLFYLRGIRQRTLPHEELDQALRRWMEGTAVKPLAELVLRVLQRTGARTVEEVYPGVGLTFEYLRLLLEAGGGREGNAELGVAYTGVGPEASRQKLLALHADEDPPARFLTEAAYGTRDSSLAPTSPTVRVYNHNQELRHRSEGAISLAEFMTRSAGGPAVLSLRVTCAVEAAARTTVKGRHVILPALGEVLATCAASQGHWQYRFLKGFDGDFFIPDGTGETGALFAFGGAGAEPEAGFELICRE